MAIKTSVCWSGAIALLISAPVTFVPATGQAATIDNIVVTTRRTSENLQDVPLAISALSEDFIEKQGIVTTADVVKQVPGVQFDQSFSAADTRISIRGINSERGRSSTAVLVDGVDVSGENITAGGGSSLLNTRLLDLERVEIIKGPQSALYGRNAFAGAINYITKKPSMDEFEINFFGDAAGRYDIYEVRGSITGPIIRDLLAISVNVGAFESDGFYENQNSADPTANGELGGGESLGGRFVALWTPTDTFSITAAVSYTENETDPRPVVGVGPANTFYFEENELPAGTTPDFSFNGAMTYGQWLGTVTTVRESDINLSSSKRTGKPFEGTEDDTLFGYVKLEWESGPVVFKSMTSYLDNEAFLHEDAEFQDGVGTPILRANGVLTNFSVENDYLDQTDTEYFNQEFTFESRDWERGRWLLGMSAFYEDTINRDYSLGWFNDPNFEAGLPTFCLAQTPLDLACSYQDSLRLGTPSKDITRETTSYSIFGLVSYDVTDKLSVTAEARWIDDEIEVGTNTSVDRVSQYILAIPIDFSLPLSQLPVSDTQESDTINPRIAIDYRLTDDAMIYLSAAKGTKPAGFGTAQFAMPQNTRIRQEKLWGYELGAKTGWFDGALQANVAVFFNDYTDRQVGITTRDPVSDWASAGVTNAGAAETQGIEIDFLWRPIDPLSLSLGYAYVDAEWTDFRFEEIRANTVSPNPNDLLVRPKDQAECGNAQGDCSGAPVAGIPEHAVTILADYRNSLVGEIDWFVNFSAQYQDERAVKNRIATPYIDSFWNVDARLGVESDNWSVQLYANNLFDDDTVRWGQGYNDFRSGMYGGSAGGEPRDETVFAFLPPPRVVGLRATYRFGG